MTESAPRPLAEGLRHSPLEVGLAFRELSMIGTEGTSRPTRLFGAPYPDGDVCGVSRVTGLIEIGQVSDTPIAADVLLAHYLPRKRRMPAPPPRWYCFQIGTVRIARRILSPDRSMGRPEHGHLHGLPRCSREGRRATGRAEP